MASTAAERLDRWAAAESPAGALPALRRAFAAIWLLYDALDLALGATASSRWVGLGEPHPIPGLTALQLGLIAAEAGLLAGLRPAPLFFAVAVLRAAESYLYFPLNDFYFCAVAALILSQLRWDPDPRAPERRWPRDLLAWQLAWTYFATALLKTSTAWLSGGHLFVRHAYQAAVGWPYPAFYRAWTSSLRGNAVLAWAGLGCELGLAVLLARRGPRWAAVALAVAVHGFSAVAVNVWFFGATMVVLVWAATEPERPLKA